MKSAIKPLRVAFVYDDSLDGSEGVAQYAKTLGQWLSGRGHRVSYMAGQTQTEQIGDSRIYSLSKNLAVAFNDNRLSVPLWGRRRAIKAALDQEQPDVLHVQMPHSPFMAQRLVAAAQAQTAIVGTFHIYPANRLADWGSRLLRLIYGNGLKRFDEIVSVSPAAQSFAASAFGLRTEVLPNVVDLKKFQAPPAQQDAQIVFLGRLVKRKGAEQLIRAFALVSQKLSNARLSIAGDGPQKSSLMRLVQQLELTDKVNFLGFVDEADKPRLLAGAAVACFPSSSGESFGIVLIEAMAAGAGVVLAGDNPGYRSVMGGQDDMLVEPDDITAMADKIVGFLSQPAKIAAAHDWQAARVKQFDVEIVGPQIEELYLRAIAKNNRFRDNS